jgi:hypothetical protein
MAKSIVRLYLLCRVLKTHLIGHSSGHTVATSACGLTLALLPVAAENGAAGAGVAHERRTC